MRLINTRTLKFSEFYGSNIPKYAILSHTWGAEEITYSEWLSRDQSCLAKEGYKKIYGACRQAFTDGLDWLWVDTNCIDKSSSAELTEAINSMYQWYERSQVCYAYLVDVPSHHSRRNFHHCFTSSRWFARGWTLQELLAPRRLTFYSKEWLVLGDRSHAEISKSISEVIGIEDRYLIGTSKVSSASVAQRMSWLSKRRTTREEDIAYCMLGVFGINMPLLYGEGSRAFTRLQEEIIKISHDHSLFCWTRTKNTPLDWDSILAPSPEEFENSGDYVPKEHKEELTPYAMTNLGLSIQLPVIHTFTHPFVLLNAGLRYRLWDYRACLSMTYGSGLSAPDHILFRHWFPEGPINLEPHKASLMRRHHFYISSRLLAPPKWRDPDVPILKIPNILIVMQSTDRKLFRGSRPVGFQKPENSGLEVSTIDCPSIDTYPQDTFDDARGILQLPNIETRSGPVNACVMSLFYPHDSEHGYFLFFGCRNNADHKREWGCEIMSVDNLRRQKERSNRVMKILLQEFVKKDFSDRTERFSSVSDGSLILHLGGSVPSGQDQSLKLATLRGPKQESIEGVGADIDEELTDHDSNCGVAGDF